MTQLNICTSPSPSPGSSTSTKPEAFSLTRIKYCWNATISNLENQHRKIENFSYFKKILVVEPVSLLISHFNRDFSSHTAAQCSAAQLNQLFVCIIAISTANNSEYYLKWSSLACLLVCSFVYFAFWIRIRISHRFYYINCVRLCECVLWFRLPHLNCE